MAAGAALCGLLAALGSTFGKIAFSPSSPIKDVARYLCLMTWEQDFSVILEYFLRALFFALMISSNVFMMSLFVDTLQKQNSTLTVTAISTSANFIATGCIGIFFFQEIVPLRWYCGALFCALGSALISLSQMRFGRTD